jgi:hypothetical protein
MKRFLITAILACLALFLVLPCVALASDSFTVGPTSVNITTPQDGTGTVDVYITSNFDGKLIVGTENLPFTVEPKEINVTSTDQNKKVHLSLKGNASAEQGQYSGKITFLAYSGGNVAYGVKIKANVTQTAPEGVAKRIAKALQANYILIIVCFAVLAALVVVIVVRRRTKKQTQ